MIIGTVTEGLFKRLEDLDVGGRGETIQTTAFSENGQNTEKRSGDLRRLAVTQTPVKDHQITLMRNTLVPWRTEKMPQRIQKHSRITLHRSTHPKWEQDKTEKSSYGLDWKQKGIWYGPTKLDTTLSQNVQNITWSPKLYRTDDENLESGPDSRRKKHSWNKDPKRHFPKRCIITLTNHNSHDAPELNSLKMHSADTNSADRKRRSTLNVHGWHEIIWEKWKRTRNSHTRR